MFDLLRQKKLIFVSGKGGVGKTYVATNLARYFEAQGRRILILESSPIGQLGFFFGQELIPDKVLSLSDKLDVVNVSSRGNFEKYLQTQAVALKLIQPLLKNKIVISLIDAIPGLAEAMLLGRLYFQATKEYDHVIFDAPAFGHFLSMMTTPDAIMESKIGGPVSEQVLKVQNYLVSSECGTILVGQAEELVISEMLEFIPKIAEVKCPRVDFICLNRVLEGSQGHSEILKNRKIREAEQISCLKSQINIPIWRVNDLGFWQPPVDKNQLKDFMQHLKKEESP